MKSVMAGTRKLWLILAGLSLLLASSAWSQGIGRSRPLHRVAPIPRSQQPNDPIWVAPRTQEVLPASVDYRPLYPPAVDQGDSAGACVVNALASYARFVEVRQGYADPGPLSRLFTYWIAMDAEAQKRPKYAMQDGVAVRTALESAYTQGFAHESVWPYILSRYHQKPPTGAFLDAYRDRILHYSTLSQKRDQSGQFYVLGDLKSAVANGNGFVFCIVVWDGLRSENYTLLPPPPGPISPLSSAHCMVCVGYDDARQAFLIRNSWGSGWALSGYFWISYSLMLRPDVTYDYFVIDAWNARAPSRSSRRKDFRRHVHQPPKLRRSA